MDEALRSSADVRPRPSELGEGPRVLELPPERLGTLLLVEIKEIEIKCISKPPPCFPLFSQPFEKLGSSPIVQRVREALVFPDCYT